MKVQMRVLLFFCLKLLTFTASAQTVIYVPGFRTYSTDWYQTSSQNVTALKALQKDISPIRIAGFGAASPGETSLTCRLSYPVYLPRKMVHEVFLAEAMRAELIEAGLYSESAPVAVTGHLVSMDFNSFGTGKWTVEAKFSVEGKEPVTVKHVHTYPVSMGAVNGCGDVSRALVPALQGFLMAVYSDAGFKALIRPAIIPEVETKDIQVEPEPSVTEDRAR